MKEYLAGQKSEMKEYKFYVILCGGYCNGYIHINADDAHNAYYKAIEDIRHRLYKAFPELDIVYSVELCDESESE